MMGKVREQAESGMTGKVGENGGSRGLRVSLATRHPLIEPLVYY